MLIRMIFIRLLQHLKIYENAELAGTFINKWIKACTTIFLGKAAEKHIEIYDCLAHKKQKYSLC